MKNKDCDPLALLFLSKYRYRDYLEENRTTFRLGLADAN